MSRPAVAAGPGFREFLTEEIEQSLPARFEQQVERHPARLAVRSAGESLTYAELNARANRIARSILERRGEAEEPVGLLLAQGADSIAAILGVLKAGKIWVPLDSSHPRGRILEILEEAGIALLLTDGANRGLAGELAGRGRSALDLGTVDASARADNPGLPLSADRGACIFYTSGSTGRPKGVFDVHRNVLHNALRYTNTLRIGPEDRLSLVQSCTFSGTVSSVFGALANGAALFPFDLRAEGMARLAEWVASERITIFHSVPAIFRGFVDGSRRFPDLRLVRLEGDRALRLDVERYREHLEPGCVLVNGLGATETGLVRQFFLDRRTEFEGNLVPVGHPVQDMHIEILGEAGQPVAEGEPGEIAIRSRYLARGYWRRPDLDRAAFLSGPAGTGERIYRTGDLGLLLPDGCLQYLGRKDSRVKIRGQRVEPAEVEKALLDIPNIRDAVVTARPDREGELRLAAYVVASEGPPPPAAALRRALSATLPDASIPTLFRTLDALPRDGNGKVDRRALPDPGAFPPETGARPALPRDALERRLVSIWKEALGLPRVGIREDFFDLGGDSLTAARAAAATEKAMGLPVPPALLRAAPTIEALAAALREERRRIEQGDPLVTIQTGGSSPRPPFFFVPNRRGEISLCADLARRLGANQPFHVLRWTGSPDVPRLPRRIEEMAAEAVGRLRRAQPQGPYRLGGFCFGAVVAFEMARQLRAADETIALLALVGISPHDFPRLVSPAALERYRRPRLARVVRARLDHHRGRLAEASPRQTLAYLFGRRRSLVSLLRQAARPGLGRARERLADLAWRAASLLREIAGRPLPARLRDADRISRRAFASYAPRPDPGPVDVFLSQKSRERYSEDPRADFRGLSSGVLQVHEVPCRDGSMLVEPHVGVLAEQLRACLARLEGAPAASVGR
ncbi:MAG: amino acid adenylation domain-containing protein [Acidobacteriota bacterium]